MSENTIIKKVAFASLIMMGSLFASRIMGVFRVITIAGTSGIAASVDAYQIAFILPEILNHILASGFLSITFIPILSKYLTAGDSEEGYRVFSLILNSFGAILLLLIAASMVWANRLVVLLAPGITDPGTIAMAVKMTRIILPAQFFFFSGGLLMAIQFANEKFFIPALAPLIYNLSIILGGILFAPYIGMEGFAWGVLFGAFTGNFTIQFFGARKSGARYFFIFGFTHPDVIKYILLTLPLMLGLTMTFSTEILFRFFGSYLDAGSIAALDYSLRIMFAVVGMFGNAIGVASYPYMAKLAQKSTLHELNNLLNRTLMFIFLALPISTIFLVASPEVILVIYQHGAFNAHATAITAGILPFFMAGAFAFAALNIVSRGYYATQNTVFPAVLSTIIVLLSLPVIYFLTIRVGVKGVALGLTSTIFLQAMVLFECWCKKSQNQDKTAVYGFFMKLIPISALLYLILYFSAAGIRHFIDTRSFSGALTLLIFIGGEFAILFIAAGFVFKIDEIHLLCSRIFERIKKWKKK